MIKQVLNRMVVVFVLVTTGCSGGSGTQAVATVTLSVNKSQAIASTQDEVTFTATARDDKGTPLKEKIIDFKVPPGTYPFISQGQTDSNGEVQLNLKHPPVGPNRSAVVMVTAMSEGVTSNEATATFSNPQQTPANVTLTADTTSLLYSSTDRITLTATATNADGLPLAGQAFNAYVQPGPFISAINPFTNNDGQATIMVQPNNDILPFGTWTIPTSLAVTAIINDIQSNVVNISVSTP